MLNFTQDQKDYINSEIDRHIYLEACPGSGKTEVVAAKVAKEMTQWKMFPSGMAILSFANSATDVLKDRINSYSKQSISFFPHFVGTFDSFILKYVVSPIAHELTGFLGKDNDFSLRLVESGSPIYIQTKYGLAKKGKQRANQYDYDLISKQYIFCTGVEANDRVLNASKLQDWEIGILKKTKDKFLEAGFATYRDVEHLAIKILEIEKTKDHVELVAKKFPLLIIDECQDLSPEQLMILEKLSKLNVKLHLIGDLNQAIYGFRNAKPQYVNDFIFKLKVTKLSLTKNFRSGQQIVDLCTSFIPSDKVVGQKNYEQHNCKVLEYHACPTEVISKFKSLSKEHKNRVVVARGHSILNKLLSSAIKLNTVESLALSIVLFDENDMFKLEHSLNLFSEYLRNHLNSSESVKPNSFNCPVSILSSLQWRKFLFSALSYLVIKGLGNTKKDWKSWCKLLKIELQTLPDRDFVDEHISKLLDELREVNIRAPNNKGNDELGNTLQLQPQQKEQLRLATIHQVKGETYDATMVISSLISGKESHWKDWLKDPLSEAARMAYVACSRPKHLLVWAVKELNEEDKKRIQAMGFIIESNI